MILVSFSVPDCVWCAVGSEGTDDHRGYTWTTSLNDRDGRGTQGQEIALNHVPCQDGCPHGQLVVTS
jgi:hypothetical protein